MGSSASKVNTKKVGTIPNETINSVQYVPGENRANASLEPPSSEKQEGATIKLPSGTVQKVQWTPEQIDKDLTVIEKELEEFNKLEEPWDKRNEKTLSILLTMFYRYRTPEYVIPKIGDLLIRYNFFDVVVKIWDHCHSTENEDDYYLNSPSYKEMKTICWSYSDDCPKLCEEAFRHKVVIERFMREFSLPELSVEKLNDTNKLQQIQASLSFIHNSLRLYDQNRLLVRQNDGIRRLMSYYDSEHLIIKAQVMLLLAFCVNEEENLKIIAETGVIAFIMQLLKSALAQTNHIGKPYCYSASEIVCSLNKLANSDDNKVSIVEKGVLPHLTDMMTGDKFPDEHAVAANCLWSLSFHPKNKELIKREPGLIVAVCRLLNDPGSDEATRKSCVGIRFLLKIKTVSDAVPSAAGACNTKKGHIMISYQWDVQPMMLKLRDILQSKGLKVWLDIQDLKGSILCAMAAAVENASVIVVGVTEKYKNSNSCRTEAEYAYSLKKPIVPLLLEHDYKADGWLGALLGVELYERVSSIVDLSVKAPKILNMIKGKVGNEIDETVIDKKAAPLSAPPSNTGVDGPTSTKVLSKSTANDVKEWAKETGIDGLSSSLSSFDGSDLEQLVLLLKRSPDVYYNSLRIDLKLNLLQSLRFTRFLEKL